MTGALTIVAVILGLVVGGGPQSKPSAARNACRLVDREDMERLAKGKVTLLNNIESEQQSNCEIYLEGKQPREVIVLEVHWSGGRELARAGKPAAGTRARPASGKTPDVASLAAAGADDSYYSDAMAWVVKGEVFLRLTMPGLGADDMHQNFVPLARKALSRLP